MLTLASTSSPRLLELLTGMSLVTAIWGAIGVVLVAGLVVMVIFKFFVGAQKNIGGGVGALVAVSLLVALATAPQKIIDLGTYLLTLIGV